MILTIIFTMVVVPVIFGLIREIRKNSEFEIERFKSFQKMSADAEIALFKRLKKIIRDGITKKIRKEILTRDKCTCIKCGKKLPPNLLRVHHIDDIDWFLQKWKPSLKKKTFEEAEEAVKKMRNFVNHSFNLITICEQCHIHDMNIEIADFMPVAVDNMENIQESATLLDFYQNNNEVLKGEVISLSKEIKDLEKKVKEVKSQTKITFISEIIKYLLTEMNSVPNESKYEAIEKLNLFLNNYEDFISLEEEDDVLIGNNLEKDGFKNVRHPIKEFFKNERLLGGSSKLIEYTVKQLMQINENIHYMNIKDGFTFYLSQFEDKFFGIKLSQMGVKWFLYIGGTELGVLTYSKSSDKYYKQFATIYINSLEDFNKYKALLKISYDLKRGITERKQYIVFCTHCGALQSHTPLNGILPSNPHRNCSLCSKQFYFKAEVCVEVKLN